MKTTNVLLEVGLEEMPARYLDDAEQQLKNNTIEWLKNIRLPYDKLFTFITPRRFAVLIEGLAYKQEDQEEEVKGPAAKIAKDEEGNWTKAAIGFTKGQGKSVEDIYFKEIKGTEYVFVNKFIEGESQTTLLPQFKEIILALHFPKNMRWADESLRYIRPIKWIVAITEEEIIPFEIAGVQTSNVSYGHRFLGGKVQLTDPLQYQSVMRTQYVIVDKEEREKMIESGLRKLEQTENWNIKVDPELLREVTHLVEYPTVFYGSFSSQFLTIPDEVLITSMKEHQRYFPVQSHTGELLPFFIGVRNGTADFMETVVRGNEKVLHARLQDAAFFYKEDQKLSIPQNLKQLERIVFQEDMGTIADKVSRIRRIAAMIATDLKVNDTVKEQIDRAAEICKFDLVTNMVKEFTELQGIMGRKYAVIFGEEDIVAQAIEEHYMPRNAHDTLPASKIGAIVSVADKLDTIVGCYAVGILPSGSQDPYGLRRQALGILQIIQENKWELNVSKMINKVYELFKESGVDSSIDAIDKLEVFFKQRAAYIMKEEQMEADVVKAVLTNQLSDFSFLLEKGKLLSEKRNDLNFKETQEAFVRVINIASQADTAEVNPAIFQKPEEKALYQSYENIKEVYGQALADKEAEKALNHLSVLVKPIHQFFENIMVMDEDEAIRKNRLALLQKIALLLMEFADLTEIKWKQHQG